MKTASSNIASTQQFLIKCLRVFLNQEDISSSMTSQMDSVDWSALLHLASYHKVMPLLYRSLHNTYLQIIPEDVQRHLEDYVRYTQTRNLFLTRELLSLLKHLKSNGIKAIPLKGPILAHLLYGDPTLRQSVDLDILIHQKDFFSAKMLLLSLGYRTQYSLTSRQEMSYLNSVNHIGFTLNKDDVIITVELHRDIMPKDFPFYLSLEDILGRCKRVSIAGTEVVTFSPEDLLLFLCAHGSKHMWTRLQWLCDVAQLMKTYPTMDWGTVAQRAKTSGGWRMLLLSIFLINDLFCVPVPDEILKKAEQDPVTLKLSKQVKQRLFNGACTVPATWKKIMYMSQLRGQKVLDCYLYFVRDFFRAITTPTPADWMSIPLPDTFFPLYYVLRPVRLAGNYGLRAVSYIYNLCKGK